MSVENPFENRNEEEDIKPEEIPSPDNEQYEYIGAKKKPDGSWDLSRAMRRKLSKEEVAQRKAEDEQQKERKKKERERDLEIPDDVKPGTSTMLFYTLRNSLYVNRESLEKAKAEGKPEKALQGTEDLIKKQELEKAILSDTILNNKIQRKIEKEAENKGEELTSEQVRERMRDLSADEMYNYVQELFIDWLDKLEEDGEETAQFVYKGSDFKHLPIKDLRKAAENLQSRLIDEANRSGKK